MASATILSQTLRSITSTKVKELDKQRQSYEKLKQRILAAADAVPDDICKRIDILADGVEELDIWSEDELHDIRLWLHQSKYDSSVPRERLEKFEHQLRASLGVRSRKLGVADLYSRLLIEWTDSPQNGYDSDPSMPEDGTMPDDSQLAEDRQKERLEELREKFERVVFTPLMTDEVEIDLYLSSLFEGDAGETALARLRYEVKRKGKSLLSTKRLFDRQGLEWSIKSLLRSDMLNEEKKSSLQAFLQDEAVLNEIKDVLNMRYADIQNWSWDLGDRGIFVEPRRGANGKWRVMMDDDVLQTLFTHWIGTQWAVRIKEVLKDITKRGLWKDGTHSSENDSALLQYYLQPSGQGRRRSKSGGVAGLRQMEYMENFVLNPLPSRLFENSGGYDDDDEEDSGTESTKLSGREMRQLLLRTMATEVHVRRSLDGEVAILQSDFQWFGTSMAHSSIFAVLRFIGFPEEWISFFKKVLEPPLQMEPGGPVRMRKRGLPMDHILGKLIGELVLFFMDLAVNRETGMNLYRNHDDLWLCGSPENCAKSWKIMEQHVKIMGLELNKSKTGSVYLVDGDRKRDAEVVKALPEGRVEMNFLILDPDSGEWVINREHVFKHAKQLQKQLAGSKSILDWVKMWNSCIGRFFSYTFGEPANCFGRVHVDRVLDTHKDIQSFLFNDSSATGSSVSEQLVRTISERFDFSDISNAFLYLPESLGGLALHNPFTPLLLAYDSLVKDPRRIMRDFIKEEREEYESAKREFESETENSRRKRYRSLFPDDWVREGPNPVPSWDAAQEFFSFEEYTCYRDRTSVLFLDAYEMLMAEPGKRDLQDARCGSTVTRALESLANSSPDDGLEDIRPRNLSEEKLWTVHFYSDELFEKFGGLSLVDSSLISLGMLKAMRSERVTWRMIL